MLTDRRRAREASALTLEQANVRIAELRGRCIPPRCGPERLDGDLDADIRVTSNPPRHHFELMRHGLAVSWLTVIDYAQQVGGATWRMGGIAGVGTHAEHRFHGYSRRVIEYALRWMRREGFATSMLFGIPCYYPKYGFAPALPESQFLVATRDAESVAPRGLRFVDMAPEHVPAVLRLYHAGIHGWIGPVHRRAPWVPRRGLNWETRAGVRVGLDRAGRVAAYAVFQQENFTVALLEAGWSPSGAGGGGMADILHEAVQRAVAQRVEQIRVTLPEAHPLSEFCRPLGTRQETTCVRDGRAMVRMIDTAAALRAVAPELARRAAGAGGQGAIRPPNGELTLRTNLDTVRLRWSADELQVDNQDRQAGRDSVRLPQWALAQLLYGYRSAASLAATGLARGPARAIAVLDALFPRRPTMFHYVDHF